MSEVVHLEAAGAKPWCGGALYLGDDPTREVAKATCLRCLEACAEYGSEARHRREVLIEAGVKP